MKTKEKIIEVLEGKRTEQVWELIEKSYLEVFEDTNKKDLEIAKEEYLECEGSINDKRNKYIFVEHYNLYDGFYGRFYTNEDMNNWGFEDMYEDYFSDCNGNGDEILLVDMKEKKCYLIDKKVSYDKKEVEI